MFGRTYRLFDLLGIPIRVDSSWFLIVVLVVWSLSISVFPDEAPGLSRATYFALGTVGATCLFASIVFHELCHAAVARAHGVRTRSITLFIFGGVAEMEEEPPTARAELLVAIAGPLGSALLAALALGVRAAGRTAGWSDGPDALAGYLAGMNGVLAVFNLVPAFPLDGGRVLRAVLWLVRGDLTSSTRIAASIGAAFGSGLVVLGVLAWLAGDVVGAIWWALIGLFVRRASQASYQQLLVRRALEGEPVRKFMQTELVTVDPSTSVAALVDDYLHRHHFKTFPVVEAGRLVGSVQMSRIRDLPRDEWPRTTVAAVATPLSPGQTIDPGEDAVVALSRMSRGGSTRLLVVEGDRLVGILALRDLLRFLEIKVELGP